MSEIFRVFVEKKDGYNIEAKGELATITGYLGIKSAKALRVVHCYDVQGLSADDFALSISQILSEANVDDVYCDLNHNLDDFVFGKALLPGQYDQRADWAAFGMQVLTGKLPKVRYTKFYIIAGGLSNEDKEAVLKHFINPVDSMEATLEMPKTLEQQAIVPEDVKAVDIINLDDKALAHKHEELALAMSIEDFAFFRDYFKTEGRNPTITEAKMVDTYWSDHCRHTTFHTILDNLVFEEGAFSEVMAGTYQEYLSHRAEVHTKDKPITMMDMATIATKILRKRGLLGNLDISEEINAASFVVDIHVDGVKEEWLLMFKNETHNHPTEIEPFGGAATCLGGAIRDPLSGRSYIYQAMRVTGGGDPRKPLNETLPGKLPQRLITTQAADGYSSYGNQIGLAAGHIREIYHEGYVAKRMEVGAVIGAAKKENVIRNVPQNGDVVLLIGGRTGRDGVGGAAGSSKSHVESSLATAGAEVQKGNAIEERKLQRLFRNPDFSRRIIRCNDFGAGGVSVAIGELADSIAVNLDAVRKKYDGLDGTELAISESQERMAVVVKAADVEHLINLAKEENVEAYEVAKITDTNRLEMMWRGQKIVDISREFLNTSGVVQHRDVVVAMPLFAPPMQKDLTAENWLANLACLNVASQKGMIENFDSTVGAGTVLAPFGGKYQLTQAGAMAARVPVLKGECDTASLMAFGFDPYISEQSPYHGAVYAVVESVARLVAAGACYTKVYLSFQEYFERLTDEKSWGKPVAALLGALHAQLGLEVAAISGKDSMSGTYKDAANNIELKVPPTLISFGATYAPISHITSNEFKAAGNKIALMRAGVCRCEFDASAFESDFTSGEVIADEVCPKAHEEASTKHDGKSAERCCGKLATTHPKFDEHGLPCFDSLKANFAKLNQLITSGNVVSAHVVGFGGLGAAISQMAFGNKIGVDVAFDGDYFAKEAGMFVLEVAGDVDGVDIIGKTTNSDVLKINGMEIGIDACIEAWMQPLEDIFPTGIESIVDKATPLDLPQRKAQTPIIVAKNKVAKPKVFLPVFPGTNCEYDMARSFEGAGAVADIFVINNQSPEAFDASIKEMVGRIQNAQIIALSGGFSAADEPEGSAKFIAAVLSNPHIKEAVHGFLDDKEGLMLGICNGFQALVKLGLLPFGKISPIQPDSPTLTYNGLGRHISNLVNTKIVSNTSPWLAGVKEGDIHRVAASHGQGRFTASEELARHLFEAGQVASVYVDLAGNPTMDLPYNPNGSFMAIEGITDPTGRILGKMCHSERGALYKNIPGDFDQKIFEAAVDYYR
ncbi:MAG: phosphoribosylformylglycinamidine synthase [Defluviitaleaceae bacterium]|nr:phosphoribosylformylglycinamidine synthase [Defluviitaleaceae bacterium]